MQVAASGSRLLLGTHTPDAEEIPLVCGQHPYLPLPGSTWEFTPRRVQYPRCSTEQSPGRLSCSSPVLFPSTRGSDGLAAIQVLLESHAGNVT